jgi:hypothetical protein
MTRLVFVVVNYIKGILDTKKSEKKDRIDKYSKFVNFYLKKFYFINKIFDSL